MKYRVTEIITPTDALLIKYNQEERVKEMPKIKITEATLKEFFELLDRSELTQRKAAEQMGFGLESLRKAAERLNVRWYKRRTVKEAIRERAEEIQRTPRPQTYWAKEFGISQGRIGIIFKQLGLHSKQSGTRRGVRPMTLRRRLNEYRKILGYLAENGGYVTDAIKALGLRTYPQRVRDYAKSIGFEIRHYRFAYQEYGQWLTLPGPWRKTPPSNYIVPAMCRSCGEVYELSLQNAKSGKSHCCSKCASATRLKAKVLNVETGKIYRSVLGWSKAIGRYRTYQKDRIELKQKGRLEIDGTVYELVT